MLSHLYTGSVAECDIKIKTAPTRYGKNWDLQIQISVSINPGQLRASEMEDLWLAAIGIECFKARKVRPWHLLCLCMQSKGEQETC